MRTYAQAHLWCMCVGYHARPAFYAIAGSTDRWVQLGKSVQIAAFHQKIGFKNGDIEDYLAPGASNSSVRGDYEMNGQGNITQNDAALLDGLAELLLMLGKDRAADAIYWAVHNSDVIKVPAVAKK